MKQCWLGIVFELKSRWGLGRFLDYSMNDYFAVVWIGLENELIVAFPATEPKKIPLLDIAAFVVGPLQRSTKWVFLVVVCGIVPVDSPDLVGLTDVGLAIFVLVVPLSDNAAAVVEVAAVAATAVKVKLLFQMDVVVPVKPMCERHVVVAVPAAAEVPFAVVVFAAFDVAYLASSLFGKVIQFLVASLKRHSSAQVVEAAEMSWRLAFLEIVQFSFVDTLPY